MYVICLRLPYAKEAEFRGAPALIDQNPDVPARSCNQVCVSPRWFHKLNVYAARVLNAPILLMIGVWERRRTIFGNNGRLPIYLLARRFLNATTARHDLHMVFELPPELEVSQNIGRDTVRSLTYHIRTP